MRRQLVFVGFVLFMATLLVVSVCHAADVSILWKAVDRATGYKIYKSEDLRLTWDTGLDVGMGTPDGAFVKYTYQGVREDLSVDFRVSAYGTDVETVRLWSGAWYDHTLRPVDDPGGAGIE